MSLIKRITKISATISVVLLVLVLASALVCAQMPHFPMRLDISITGMPGSTCHLQVYNASGLVFDNPSAGSTVSNVNVFGSDGSAIHFHIDGRDTGVTTTMNGGGYAQVTLAYPPASAIPSPSPSPSPSASATTNPSGGNSGSFTYGSGGINTAIPTPFSAASVTPSTIATATATTTPTITPTPTPAPSATATTDNGFPWWLLLIFLVIIVIAGAAYWMFFRNR